MTNFVIALKWVLLVITLIRVSADDTHGIERRDTNGEPKKVVCYYTNWSVYRPGTAKFTPQNINPYLCTHLIYAFGGLDKDNGLRPYDKYQDIEQGGFAKFTGLKTYNKNLKTMLAIGGWNEGSSRFSSLVGDEDRRAAFVKNVVKFLRTNNFDGLDLDWEYPAYRDGSKPRDKENYASLVKELRDEFERESSKTGRPRLLLTMAVPAGVEYIDKGYDIPKLNRYLDFMNILSYDYHSAYEPNVNHHAPLYSLQEESEYNFDALLTIDHTIKHYLKKGADPEKLVLGIPTYGRSYTLFNPDSTDLGSASDGPGEQGEATREKGYLAYYEICANVASDEWKVVQPKKSAMGPYAYRENQWVGYDDADIIKTKAKYINEKGLGGIMYWAIDNDDFRGKCHGKPYPLIEAGKAALLANSGNSPNAIAASTEEKRTKLATRKNRPKHRDSSTSRPKTTTIPKTTTTTSTTLNPLSTPEPPTTPDSGTDFVCKEDGFFPHPRDCKKYFWCLDSGPSNLGIVAHQFTCPSGLMFNKLTDSCDYSRNVICNKKSDKTTPTTTTTTTAKSTTALAESKATTTTSTTTTTEPPPKEDEYEDEDDVESEEDPKAIKQLITLIKKLGGINELEKQLKIEEGSKEATTPVAFSKNLYNKVFSNPPSNRFRNQHRNAPSKPQNEGVPSSTDDEVPYRKDKPQYVTIQRSRPMKNVPQDTEDSGTTNNKAITPSKDSDYVEEEEIDVTTSKYASVLRSRNPPDSRSTSPKYVVLERTRPAKTTTEEEEEVAVDSPTSTTHRYITLVRNRATSKTSTVQNEDEEPTTTESSTRATRLLPTRTTITTEAVAPTATEKPRDKVSSTENTTAQTLSVTSAQYVTARPQTSTSNTTDRSVDSNTNSSNTYLVFPQTVSDQLQFSKANDRVDSPTSEQQEAETSTVPQSTSIATTVYSTVRESATEKTRIPLKMYREFLKKNRTTDKQEDLPTNLVEDSRKLKDTSATTTTTPRYIAFFRGRKLTTTTETSSSSTHTTTAHTRLFARRKSNATSTTLGSSTEAGSVTPRHSSRFRPTPEPNPSIDNFFKRRRASTTEPSLEAATSSPLPSRGGSRYFSKTHKPLDTPTDPTPHRSRFYKDDVIRRTTKSQVAEPSSPFTDQLSQSDSTEQELVQPVDDSTTLKPGIESTTHHRPSYLDHRLRSVTTSTEGLATPHVASTHRPSHGEHFRHRTHSEAISSTEGSFTLAPHTTSAHKASYSDHLKHRTHQPQVNTTEISTQATTHRGLSKYHNGSGEHSLKSAVSEHFHHWARTTTANPSSVDKAVPATTHRISIAEHHRLRTHPKQEASSLHRQVEDLLASTQRTVTEKYLESTPSVTTPSSSSLAEPEAPSSETYSRINPRNNSRFLKNPESEYRQQQHRADQRANSSPKRGNSPMYLIQRATSDSVETSTTVDPNAALAVQRSRKKFTPTDGSPAADSSGRQEGRRFRVSSSPNSVSTEATTVKPKILNRGSIKARNSLSRAEIKELANLVEPSPKKGGPHPINKIEESYFDATTSKSRFAPRHRFEDAFSISNTDNFGFSKIYTLPNELNERLDQHDNDLVDDYYFIGEPAANQAPIEQTSLTDVFRVSETKYTHEGARHVYNAGQKSDKPKADLTSTEQPTRFRGNFRPRNNTPQRTRSTTTTTTTTTEEAPAESNKLSSRFRRRKGRPENRSINPAQSESLVSPLSETETATVTRHKNYDISHRGSAIVSDYLPVPESLYRHNQTIYDQLNAANLNLEDLDAQTINPPNNNYHSDDVADLANPAVAALTHLKTLSPTPQITYPKTVTLTPQIIYTTEPELQYHRIKSAARTTAAPLYRPKVSHRRGGSRISGTTSTTTHAPSLQDIYNDYQETDAEYHAEPVEIPIAGKVRIHSDGYIECLDMGNFPHPFSCRKFISCAKMDFDSLLGWEYTCPKGLSFDPIGGICNWAAGLGCKD